MSASLPFLWGAQYYRAPTPEPACWKADFARMQRLGFNAVKFWVQWRQSHHRGDRFVYDDLDRLMDLAAEHNLQVTLNVIFDVAPSWLYEKFPDAKPVTADGHVIESMSPAHRQIGGHPGPCYHHEGAREARETFLRDVVAHFRGHPAMGMWDLWNEPEQCFPVRAPELNPGGGNLVSYSPAAVTGFRQWLQQKYDSLDALNARWGRYYEQWEDVEAPLTAHTLVDFLDWRFFHLERMTHEANWRYAVTAELDPEHIRYLHVVPSAMSMWNAITGVEDESIMAGSQVYAASMAGWNPPLTAALSTARGRLIYNVESHVNSGGITMHPRRLELPQVGFDLLAQIGMGVRGFLFWQFRPEVLGCEAPAWGLVKPDGSDRPVTAAAEAFHERLGPHFDTLLSCPAPTVRIGLWKSDANEIFHFGIHHSFARLQQGMRNYLETLFWTNHTARYVTSGELVRQDLEGLELLIMADPYALTEDEAEALAAWVEAGGVLLCEAHLGGWNASTGRHSRTTPGCGLSARFGIHEVDTTSPLRMEFGAHSQDLGNVSDDVRKALEATGATGDRFFPLAVDDGSVLFAADRYAILDGGDVWAHFGDDPLIISKPVGKGRVVYAGTNLGVGAERDPEAFRLFLARVLELTSLSPTLGACVKDAERVRVDAIRDNADALRYVVLRNEDRETNVLQLEAEGTWRGLLFGDTFDFSQPISLASRYADIFVPA